VVTDEQARALGEQYERATDRARTAIRPGMRGWVGDEEITVLSNDYPGSDANHDDPLRFTFWRHRRQRWDVCNEGWIVVDLRDPATRGAALEVVRERWQDPLAWLDWLQTASGLEWYVNVRGHGDQWFAGASEAEALVAALESAPKP
jgi:hypothetical protein